MCLFDSKTLDFQVPKFLYQAKQRFEFHYNLCDCFRFSHADSTFEGREGLRSDPEPCGFILPEYKIEDKPIPMAAEILQQNG